MSDRIIILGNARQAAASAAAAAISASEAEASAALAAGIATGANFIDEIAGGDVAAIATTAAGDLYFINATGGGYTLGEWIIRNGDDDAWVVLPEDAFYNAPLLDSKLAARAPRQGIVSTGASSAATVPDNTSLAFGTDDFSVGLWVGLPDWTPASQQALLSKDSASSAGFTLGINTTTGAPYVYFRSGAVTYLGTAGVGITDRHFALVCASFDRNGSLTFYVNGVQLGSPVDISATSATSLTSTADLKFLTSGGGSFFAGTTGEAFIYDGLLSSTQVAQINANGTARGLGLSMLAHWVPSDTLAAGIFEDVSGNNNHAVLGASGISTVLPIDLPSDAPAQALEINNANDSRVYNTLNGQGWGTGNGAVRIKFRYPQDADGTVRRLLALTPSISDVVQANTVMMSYNSSNTAHLGFYVTRSAATTGDYLLKGSAPLARRLEALGAAGIPVALTLVWEDGDLSLYLAVAGMVWDVTNLLTTVESGTAPVAGDDLDADYIVLGYEDSSRSSEVAVYELEHLNLAPTLTDVQYRERMGRWHEKFAKGSQVDLASAWGSMPSPLTGFTGAGGAGISSTTDPDDGGNDVLSATGGTSTNTGWMGPADFSVVAGQQYRISGRVRRGATWNATSQGFNLVLGTNTSIGSGTTYSDTGALDLSGISSGVWENFEVFVTATATGTARLRWRAYSGGGGSDATLWDDVTITAPGVTAALDLSDAGGLQPKNPRAENGSSHWTMSTTGVSYANPNRIGKTVLADLAASTSVQQLTGASVVPVGWEIVRARAKVDSGTSTVTFGSASGTPADYCASTVVGTAWTTVPITAGITTTNNIYAQLGTAVAGDVEFDIQPRGNI